MMNFFKQLKQKAYSIRTETLKLHKLAPETRLASSLSDVEIFTVLYYGGIINYNCQDLDSESRDRLIVSKAHGAVSLYPVFADLNFFEKIELTRINKEHALLGVIPDNSIPGFETTNGSLGHGLGVACGMAMGIRRKGLDRKVFVVCGDGELNSGAVWEAVMLASFHQLKNLILIVDDNKRSMLGYQKQILGLEPLAEKFEAFKWSAKTVDGHDVKQLHKALNSFKNAQNDKPKVLIADTVKGKGIPLLEKDPICHAKTMSAEQIDTILEGRE